MRFTLYHCHSIVIRVKLDFPDHIYTYLTNLYSLTFENHFSHCLGFQNCDPYSLLLLPFKGNRAICWCASTPRSPSVWGGGSKPVNTESYGKQGRGLCVLGHSFLNIENISAM